MQLGGSLACPAGSATPLPAGTHMPLFGTPLLRGPGCRPWVAITARSRRRGGRGRCCQPARAQVGGAGGGGGEEGGPLSRRDIIMQSVNWAILGDLIGTDDARTVVNSILGEKSFWGSAVAEKPRSRSLHLFVDQQEKTPF